MACPKFSPCVSMRFCFDSYQGSCYRICCARSVTQLCVHRTHPIPSGFRFITLKVEAWNEGWNIALLHKFKFWNLQLLRSKEHLEILKSWEINGCHVHDSWNLENLKCWDLDILKSSAFELLKSCNLEILKSRHLEILRSWNLDILKSWNFAVILEPARSKPATKKLSNFIPGWGGGERSPP